MRTLHDAREYMVKLGNEGLRREWQRAAELLLDTAKNGDIEACTRQIELAMLLGGKLKPNKQWAEKQKF